MSEGSRKAVLEAVGISKVYRDAGKEVNVLRQVDVTVHAGDFMAITGASGSGKSTLLNLLAGLDLATSGRVTLWGQSLSELSERQLCRLRNRHLGFVFQLHHLLPEFNALENAALPLLLGGKAPAVARQKAGDFLERVGLGQRLTHKPGQLSGGERQRVAIARALAAEPDVVLADEPTGNLDEQTAAGVQTLLAELNRDLGIAFLVVTHDREFSNRCQRCLDLHEGELHSIR